MKLLFFTVILFTCNTISFTQSNCDCYERLTELAGLKSTEEKNDSALFYYQQAFAFLPAESINYRHHVNLARYFGKANQTDSAATHLIRAIQMGYSKEYMNYNANLKFLADSTIYKEAILQAHHLTDATFNWEYYNAFQQLYGIDQIIRTQRSFNVLGRDSVFYMVDSITFDKAMRLVKQYGYPQQSKHGFTDDVLSLILLHASVYGEKQYDQIVELMNENMDNCLCLKGNLAVLKDRRLDWYYREKQLAGTWNYPGEFNPIEDLDMVDSIRFSHNLLNLAEFAKKSNRTLPKKYQPTPYPKNYFCQNKWKQ